jgi:hypothetical protein
MLSPMGDSPAALEGYRRNQRRSVTEFVLLEMDVFAIIRKGKICVFVSGL